MSLATASDLASFLQKDVDTSSANLALSIASDLFELAAGTKFSPTTVTYQVEGRGQPVISIPYSPLISIQQVRIAGTVLTPVTDYTQVMSQLYRVIGWGRIWGATIATAPYVGFPPELVEVDLTYGHSTCPNDVKGQVLETAGAAYQGPDITVAAEQIDDYRIEMSRVNGGVQLSPAALALAERYRSGGFA